MLALKKHLKLLEASFIGLKKYILIIVRKCVICQSDNPILLSIPYN